MFENLNWKYKNPFIEEFTVIKEDIDILGHVNNKVYLNWYILLRRFLTVVVVTLMIFYYIKHSNV